MHTVQCSVLSNNQQLAELCFIDSWVERCNYAKDSVEWDGLQRVTCCSWHHGAGKKKKIHSNALQCIELQCTELHCTEHHCIVTSTIFCTPSWISFDKLLFSRYSSGRFAKCHEHHNLGLCKMVFPGVNFLTEHTMFCCKKYPTIFKSFRVKFLKIALYFFVVKNSFFLGDLKKNNFIIFVISCQLSCDFSIVKCNAFFGVRISAWNPVCVQKMTFCKSVFGGIFSIIDCVSNISITICVTFWATNKMIHLVRNIWHADELSFWGSWFPSPAQKIFEDFPYISSLWIWLNF